MDKLRAFLFGLACAFAGGCVGVAVMAFRVSTVGDAAAIMVTGFTAVAVGVATAIIAFWAALDNGRIARQRTTLQHIAKSETDGDLIKANRTFIACSKEQPGLLKYAEAEFDGTEEGQAIRLILNDFELISIGIELGIIDYELYNRWHRSSVILYWKKAHPFIARVRERLERPVLWHEFEQMAKWMDENKAPERKFGKK